jgi:hypothetical protein
MRACELPEVKSFLAKMDSDCAQMKREFDAELQLAEAVENYEKVFKVKIRLAAEEVKV